VVLARIVGPAGRVIAVERDEAARARARALIAASGAVNVDVVVGTATDTGLPPRSVDVVVMRHVLAHNGLDEQRIVDHLVHLSGRAAASPSSTSTAPPPASSTATPASRSSTTPTWSCTGGAATTCGPARASRQLLTRAGLSVVLREGRYSIARPLPGVRPPAWAAREALVEEGLATADDVRALGGRLGAHGRRGGAADVLRARLRRPGHGAWRRVRTPAPLGSPMPARRSPWGGSRGGWAQAAAGARGAGVLISDPSGRQVRHRPSGCRSTR
jgi:hypothetical protein